jgi:hypothetical protein
VTDTTEVTGPTIVDLIRGGLTTEAELTEHLGNKSQVNKLVQEARQAGLAPTITRSKGVYDADPYDTLRWKAAVREARSNHTRAKTQAGQFPENPHGQDTIIITGLFMSYAEQQLALANIAAFQAQQTARLQQVQSAN